MAAPNRAVAPYLWMICGCFFLAWMGQFAHLLKDACDWRVVALARSSLAFIFALGLARLSGARLVLWRPGALWLRGCASSLSLLFTFFALGQLPASEVLTLTNTFPIWVAVLSWPLLRVRPTLSVWLAAGLGLIDDVITPEETGPWLRWFLGLASDRRHLAPVPVERRWYARSSIKGT